MTLPVEPLLYSTDSEYALLFRLVTDAAIEEHNKANKGGE